MTTSKPFASWWISVMLLLVLLSGCAASSPKPSESPAVAPRKIPPLSKAARQSQPSEPYSLRAKRDIEKWRLTLESASPPASSASASTTP